MDEPVSRLAIITFVSILLFAFGAPASPKSIEASHTGAADNFALDMNPSATPANTATSLGSRQTCARIEANGLQDADEDAVDAIIIDVTATNITSAHPVIGFSYDVSYNETSLTLQAHDPNFLLTVNPGTEFFDASEAVPDIDVNDKWNGAGVDTGEGAPESGTGVLHRLTISADAGAASGTYAVALSDAAHIDSRNDAFIPDNLYGGSITVGTSYCSRTDSDGDGVFDEDEFSCAGAAAVYNPSLRPERIDGAFAGISDDGDTDIDELLPSGSAAYDCDGDGYKGDAVNTSSQSSSEKWVYGTADTRPDQDPCGWAPVPVPPFNLPIGWPADLRGDSSFSANKVNIQDLGAFTAPINRMNTSPGDANYDVRWDVVPGKSGLSKDINVVDLANISNVVAPAMLGGVKAFNGPNCPWPP